MTHKASAAFITVTFVAQMLKNQKKIKSTKMAEKRIQVLIYTILNFIILGFRFPIQGFLGGKGEN